MKKTIFCLSLYFLHLTSFAESKSVISESEVHMAPHYLPSVVRVRGAIAEELFNQAKEKLSRSDTARREQFRNVRENFGSENLECYKLNTEEENSFTYFCDIVTDLSRL